MNTFVLRFNSASGKRFTVHILCRPLALVPRSILIYIEVCFGLFPFTIFYLVPSCYLFCTLMVHSSVCCPRLETFSIGTLPIFFNFICCGFHSVASIIRLICCFFCISHWLTVISVFFFWLHQCFFPLQLILITK